MKTPPEKKPFLGVRFITCNTYGRLYRNRDNSAYVGRCPKCGKPIKVPIGVHGTSKRFFEAICR